MLFRREQRMAQPSVLCQQEQAFRILVKPSHRMEL